MKLRLVCISDMHLGATESLLSHYDGDGQISKDPGPVLVALCKALRATLATIESPESPRLVLLGDALDLGLSPVGNVCRSMLHFLDEFYPADAERQLFGDIVYIPGNHDHHIWRMAQFDRYVRDIQIERKIGDVFSPATPIGDEPFIRCQLIDQLMGRVPALKNHTCHVAYPNWSIRDASGSRALVLHHGHYVDSMYKMLSRLESWLTGREPADIEDLERSNGPWIDFLWSELRSDKVIGRNVDTLYETMLDGSKSHKFAHLVGERLSTMLATSLDVSADVRFLFGLTPRKLIGAAVDFTAGQASESQRDGYRRVLSESEVANLRWYLANPVLEQFRMDDENVPDEISFIFGHTHKPFQDQLTVAPYATPAKIYNAGGWVLDEPLMMPCQGGAVILVDDDLNVVSIRLFNDVHNGEFAPVCAAGIGGFSDTGNLLLEGTAAAIEANRDLWAQFSEVARARIEAIAAQRASELGDLEPEGVAA
jgi:hypothetical protein